MTPQILIVLSILVIAIVLFITFVRRYKRCPSNRVLVIYGKTNSGASRCIHGGAAFVAKSEQPAVLLETIAAVAAGRMVFPYIDVRTLYDNPLTTLTRRELEVLSDLASGRTNKQIARDLGVSLNTVKFHVRNLFQKLGVNSRSQAIAMHLRS